MSVHPGTKAFWNYINDRLIYQLLVPTVLLSSWLKNTVCAGVIAGLKSMHQRGAIDL